jgi:CelD/BcsL family acetyltransferase involved in cellulose biosynthesis
MTVWVSCLRTVSELDALAPAWDALDRQLVPRTPFTSPAWNVLWWKHLRAQTLFAHDSLSVYALHDAAGALLAVAPMVITSRPARGPLQVLELRFFGADASVTELRSLVCAPADFDACFAALLQHAAATRDAWHLVTWSGIRRPPEDWGAAGYPALIWRRQVSDFCLTLPASWALLRAALPRNVRASIRKCYNSMTRGGFAFELRVISGPEAARDALDAFFRLHRSRAQISEVVTHADVFQDPRARAFLRDYGDYSARRGELRIFQLVVGGEIVATRIGFLLGSDLYLYYSGYDPAWARYSVMTTLVVEALKWAILNGTQVVNLSTGDDLSKTRWRPHRTTFHDAAQRSGSLLPRAGLIAGETVVVGLRSGHRAMRRWLVRLRLARRPPVARTPRPPSARGPT